jgi:hypothetical protein
MMPAITTRACTRLERAILVFLFALAATTTLRADEWTLLVEPSFMDHKMRRPIQDSQRTVLAIARIVNGEIQPLTREEKKSVHMTYPMIREQALQTASEVFKRMKPTFVRNQKKVIQYAAIESDDPLTASCVLAPEFAAAFEKTLGPDLIVAIPTRNQVLVFSKQDDIHLRLSERIIDAYLSSNHPVSREIFALENGNLRSLGVLE